MRATRLIVQLIAYYVAIFAIVWLVLRSFPEFRSYLPIGGAEQLINTSGKSNALQAVVEAEAVKTLSQSIGWLATAILGALLTALPVSWVYMSTRSAEEYDQSLISSIIILPIVVTSIVIVVQHSLALAFALGGIAGAVRFKNSLKSSGDALTTSTPAVTHLTRAACGAGFPCRSTASSPSRSAASSIGWLSTRQTLTW